MSTADRIRAQEAARAARRAGSTAADEPTVKAKKVRRTLDLLPSRHAAFDAWCAETAVQIGAARVTGQDALDALVHLVLTDETTARRARADIAETIRRRDEAKQLRRQLG